MENYLETFRECEGYYQVIKDSSGKRLTPLVGYTSKYEEGGRELQYVGEIYANFAKAETHGSVLNRFALDLYQQMLTFDQDLMHQCTGFCGAPEGGKALAVAMAIASGKQYIYPEKKILALGGTFGREESELVFDRHKPKKGGMWWIVEDIVNNLSTPAAIIPLFESRGAKVLGIGCFLNRSLKVEKEYIVREGFALPLFSLAREKTMRYRQDDPYVREDIEAGNIIWKPKNEWDPLIEQTARVLKALEA